MKRKIILATLLVLLTACVDGPKSEHPDLTATLETIAPNPTAADSAWAIYDADPTHMWNRVFRQLYQRMDSNGIEYGADELDPLLWSDTTHLLNGVYHQETLHILNEFISTHAETLIHDQLKRAMFQRDIWAVFDWLASQPEPYPSERQALSSHLAQIIRLVALSKEEILSLPDNYSLEIEARIFPAVVSTDHPEMAFLPSDIFQPDSAWVPMGREGGPTAMTHTEAFPFFGRSVFLVYVRSPDGRAATLEFIESLKADTAPITPIGTEVALVRRMLLVDDQGELFLSPLVESIQIRHFSPEQNFHEFALSRTRLLNGFSDNFVLKTDEFLLFMSHGDAFEISNRPAKKAILPAICKLCHFEHPPIPNSGNTHSIISYSRRPFSLPENQKAILFPTTLTAEAQTVIGWKQNHQTWKTLNSLWDRGNR